MKSDEIKKLIKWIGGLFSAVTQEQAHMLYQELKPFDYATVSAVVREHRKSYEFINFPALIKACKAKEHEEDNKTRAMPDQSFADVIRRQWPALKDRGDVEVALRFYRADWHRYKSDADKRLANIADEKQRSRHKSNEAGYRARTLIGCLGALCETQMDAKLAEKYAETVFDPDPGYFQQVLDEVRINFPITPRAQMVA